MAAAKQKSKVRQIQLGGVVASSSRETSTRMAVLLWGLSTVGKTTFAATAPGTKLWLSFGDEEHKSIMHRDDVLIADYSSTGFEELFKHGQSDNPFGLDRVLAENEDIETVVCDSATALTFRALQKSVADGVGAGKGFKPSMEQPGISAYGGRNAIVLVTLQGLLRVTAKHGVHLIITAHEDDPTTRKDERGNDIIDYVSIMLGGKLVNNVSFRLSEIWYMSQRGSEERRYLAVRPTRLRRPMKTRMFDSKGLPEFELTYDADKPDMTQRDMTIEGWYEQWINNNYRRIAVPNAKDKLRLVTGTDSAGASIIRGGKSNTSIAPIQRRRK